MRKPPATVDEEVRFFLADMRSERPAAPELELSRDRVLARIPRDRLESGAWHVDDYANQLRAAQERQFADRLADEIEKRKDAERRLEKQGDRVWQVILLCIGILIAAGAAGIGIGRASASHETSTHGD